jgi:hypothetical protein
MLPFAYRVNVSAAFPAQVVGTEGVEVSKANGIYTIGSAYESLAPIGSVPVPAQKNIKVWDSVSGIYNLMPMSLLAGAGATGVFTPVLSFGGNSVGIIYSTQEGSYYKIGKTVLLRWRIALTNKGTSTGAASIGGLPFTSSPNYCTLSAYVNGVSSTAIGHWQIGVNINSTSMFAQYLAAAGTIVASDVDFANISNLWGTGWYESAT